MDGPTTLIIDDRPERRKSIDEALIHLRQIKEIEGMIGIIGLHSGVFKKGSSEFLDIDPRTIRTVFLHLGDPTQRYGNEGSLDFYVTKLKKKRVAVIAYTGSPDAAKCPQPEVFWGMFDNEIWHRYMHGINDARDLNLKLFFEVWAKKPEGPPPLHLLTVFGRPHLIALLILCQGYLAAHGTISVLRDWKKLWENVPEDVKDKDNPHQLVRQKRDQTERKDWWKPALGADYKGSELKEELSISEGDKEDIGSLLQEIQFLTEGDNHEGSKVKEFTAKVSQAFTSMKGLIGDNR
jgi:hypothetical protein